MNASNKPESARSLFAGIPGPILRVQAAVLCMTTRMGMVYSVLVLDAKSLGVSAFLAGVLLAAFGGMRVLANVPTGLASEHFGRCQTSIVGLGIAALASVAAVFMHDFAGLTLCVLFQGFAIGVFNTASLSWIADLGTPQTRVRDMAVFQGTFLCGLSLGPAIGGFAVAAAGYSGPFVLQAILALCALLILWGSTDAHSKQAARFDTSMLMMLIGPAGLMYGVIFARAVSVWILLPISAKRDLLMDVRTIGLMLAIGSVANLAVLPIAALMARRFGRVPIVMISALTIVAALTLLSLGPSVPALWIASFLLGAGSGIALPVSIACAADMAGPGQTGAAMGVMRTLTDIGMLTGPIIFGAAVDRLPHGQNSGIALCVALLTAGIALVTQKWEAGGRATAARNIRQAGS